MKIVKSCEVTQIHPRIELSGVVGSHHMRHPPGHAICGCHWWSSINRRYREFPLQSLPHRQCLFHSCQSLNAESRIQLGVFGAFASLLKIVDGNMLEPFVAVLCSCCVPCRTSFHCATSWPPFQGSSHG